MRAALYDAVNHPKGTSFAERVPGLEVAGKTGTAQVGKNHKEGAEGDENNSHSWFASFAPYQKPEIAVVVLVEHGGFGAKASTPTAMEIYEAYFHKPHYERPKKKRPARPSARRGGGCASDGRRRGARGGRTAGPPADERRRRR